MTWRPFLCSSAGCGNAQPSRRGFAGARSAARLRTTRPCCPHPQAGSWLFAERVRGQPGGAAVLVHSNQQAEHPAADRRHNPVRDGVFLDIRNCRLLAVLRIRIDHRERAVLLAVGFARNLDGFAAEPKGSRAGFPDWPTASAARIVVGVHADANGRRWGWCRRAFGCRRADRQRARGTNVGDVSVVLAPTDRVGPARQPQPRLRPANGVFLTPNLSAISVCDRTGLVCVHSARSLACAASSRCHSMRVENRCWRAIPSPSCRCNEADRAPVGQLADQEFP